MILALVIVPAIAGTAAFFTNRPWVSRALLITSAVCHAALCAFCWIIPPSPALHDWLALDSLGLLFLSITSGLFLLASIYRVGSHVDADESRRRKDFEEGFLFRNAPEATFCGCMLLFLSTMTLVCVGRQFGILWVAVEATTLASAPLVYFHRHRRSLEAAWKYLLICSVGIALALLGNFFLAVASPSRGASGSMLLTQLIDMAHAGQMNASWLKAAFVLLLVGYGTKMGLAPMHTWLPDAHSEAPSVVSALLSGALLNCSFLAILRSQQVLAAAGLADFGQDMLLTLGLISMALAAAFIVRQTDYKRLLAYSSIEHMGILAVGVGLGGIGLFGAMFHALNHSLTKGMLFFAAGNILFAYHSKRISEVHGLMRRLPATGILWIAGLFAITGLPPFGTFLSEFTILSAAFTAGRTSIAIIYLVLLAIAFVGMAVAMLGMVGNGAGQGNVRGSESLLAVLPPAILAMLVLGLGFWVPEKLSHVLTTAAAALGGG
jgi:hydrogenase-4 component F